MKEKTCKQIVEGALRGRIKDIDKLYHADDQYDEDLGYFNEYGLCFDYVAPNTFRDQEQAYFRYQLSWGGPSEEFRFFVNPDLSVYQIEFWYLNWFDGACVVLKGDDYKLMESIFNDFNDCGSVEYAIKQAQERR